MPERISQIVMVENQHVRMASVFPNLNASAKLPAHELPPAADDTSGVSLSPELSALIERLANNSRDLWAAQSLSQGWRISPQRDDARKLHACLVPYAELPDNGKDYDLQVALGTPKAILSLGDQIWPTESSTKS